MYVPLISYLLFLASSASMSELHLPRGGVSGWDNIDWHSLALALHDPTDSVWLCSEGYGQVGNKPFPTCEALEDLRPNLVAMTVT